MTHILLILALAGGTVGAAVYWYAVHKGLLEDVEETKYQVFREPGKKD